jgi:hypothetical protein
LEFGFTGFTDKPLAGDVNLDGADDIIVWVAGRQGQLPRESGEFHFLVSDNKVPNVPNGIGTLVSQVFVTTPGFNPPRGAFSPAPLGNDFISQFGDEFALPLIGNFDPPVEGDAEPLPDISLGNTDNPLDTNRDGKINPQDALVVINTLNRGVLGKIKQPMRAAAIFGNSRPDANLDGAISPRDALAVINYLNRAQAEPTDHVFGGSSVTPQSIDSVFGDEDDELLEILAEEQLRIG